MTFEISAIRDRYLPNLATLAHVGANVGQEVEAYLGAGVRRLFLFEPLSGPFAELQARCAALGARPAFARTEFHLFQMALGEAAGEAEMHVAAAGRAAASSLLSPAMSPRAARRLGFGATRETAKVQRMDAIDALRGGADLLVIDVQGYELHVLRGAGDMLGRFRLILCELNRRPTYAGSATVEAVDAYLGAHGFRRFETRWPSRDWGDGLYVNTAVLPGPFETVEIDLKRPRGPLRRLAARLGDAFRGRA